MDVTLVDGATFISVTVAGVIKPVAKNFLLNYED